MLSLEQARKIVSLGLASAGGDATASADATLASAGLDEPRIAGLLGAIVNISVQQYDHGIDVRELGQNVSLGTTVGDLGNTVVRLAAGKVCSGPFHHSQPYPAPSICGQCKAKVP
jgi:hypothetical protein